MHCAAARLFLVFALFLAAGSAPGQDKTREDPQPSENDLQGGRVDPELWFRTGASHWHEFGEKCPQLCAACKKEVERTLEILAGIDYTSKHQGFSSARFTTRSLAGLAFLAEGSTLKSGKYKDALKDCYDAVFKDVIANSKKVLSWGTAYGALFLTEVYAKNPSAKLKAKLKELQQFILEKQIKTGGWIHKFGYEIVGFTNVVTLALSRLDACGIKLKGGVRKKLVSYYDDAVLDDGTILYSVKKSRLDRAQDE
ncbi:MAG: hypothetical protein ACYTAF_03375, partial [Planctomycetota bacterium]